MRTLAPAKASRLSGGKRDAYASQSRAREENLKTVYSDKLLLMVRVLDEAKSKKIT